DKFNDWASGKLFMIADEVVARQELFHIKNKLKALITGDCIRINPKNVAAHDERNHVNLVFLSNEKQPLVLEKDDRRFMVMWTPDK
ncbi:primase-helicase family protein, partial [Escherichia coli]|uniref:primase-helicase family protein n=1 Tax=Escherichia coli TaxID=562 RepID=UPI00193370C2